MARTISVSPRAIFRRNPVSVSKMQASSLVASWSTRKSGMLEDGSGQCQCQCQYGHSKIDESITQMQWRKTCYPALPIGTSPPNFKTRRMPLPKNLRVLRSPRVLRATLSFQRGDTTFRSSYRRRFPISLSSPKCPYGHPHTLQVTPPENHYETFGLSLSLGPVGNSKSDDERQRPKGLQNCTL